MTDRQYLKIGTFSKLTGVSVKSLRYYDRIGILKPARVDPDSGYRYYIPEQMILLDLIRLSLTFQLPLKELETDGTPDLKALIQNGEARAREKLKEAQDTLRLSQDALSQLSRLDRPDTAAEGTFYTAAFPPRQLLLSPWDMGRDDGTAYLKKQAQLHEQGRNAGLTLLTQQGLLLNLKEHAAQVFLAVEGDGSLFSVPGGAYRCTVLPERSLRQVPAILAQQNISVPWALCLNTDIYDYCLVHHLHRLELQIPQYSDAADSAWAE